MIKEKVPITYIEAAELVEKTERAEKLRKFVKEFNFTDKKKVLSLKEKLKSLNLYKLNDEAIVNLINFLPETAQDIFKILPEVSFTEEEVNKILGVFKEE
ncbi:MAG: hypothetical protein QXX68_01290 [Candidatus Pacearchaeota archaeon]